MMLTLDGAVLLPAKLDEERISGARKGMHIQRLVCGVAKTNG